MSGLNFKPVAGPLVFCNLHVHNIYVALDTSYSSATLVFLVYIYK